MFNREQAIGKMDDCRKHAVADGGTTKFATFSPYAQAQAAESFLARQFANLPIHSLDDASILASAAWALVAARLAYSDFAVFDVVLFAGGTRAVNQATTVPTFSSVQLRIQLAREQRVSGYLQDVSHQIAKKERIDRALPQTLLVLRQHGKKPAQNTSKNWCASLQQQWTNMYPLVLELELGTGELTAVARADSRVVLPVPVGKLLERLEVGIRHLHNSHPDHVISEISIATQQDLEELWEWNKVVPSSLDRCIHDMIQERALANPNTPAVSAWDGDLTYGELDMLAAVLAGQLVQLGVARNILVLLCFEKSLWTTVAMLGVLKAGGGIVLIDPSLPEQRLQLISREIKANLILSSLSNYSLSSRLATTVVIVNSSSFTTWKGDEVHQQLPGPEPSSILYVLFTSGSTGTPKGVIICHRNVASAIHYQARNLGFTSESRVFDFASYSFAAHINIALTTLCVGGCLCVPHEEDRKNDLQESIASFHATVVELTPSVAQFLEPDELPELQTIIFGGEMVHTHHILPWWRKVRVFNTYGLSECVATSTINIGSSTPEEAIRIGKGAGLVCWVVDPEDQHYLLPTGCTGELILEGPLIGRGYLNDLGNAKTAFIEDPKWLVMGSPVNLGRHGRLFKTGDLARFDGDGNLTFVGRKDTQVKIRGQRVELAEVELAVQDCVPEASQVVAEAVVPRGGGPSTLLAVFLEMRHDETDSLGTRPITLNVISISPDVEDKLAGRLPSYMLPKVFFTVLAFPRTASGKINRKQLRETGSLFSTQQLAEMQTTNTGQKQQPMCNAARKMQRIWGQVLKIDPESIGLDDSFFKLGGDSMTAMLVVGMARKAGIRLTVADVFRHPTVGETAKQAKQYGIPLDTDAALHPFMDLNTKESLYSEISFLGRGIDAGSVADILPLTSFQEIWLRQNSKYRQQFYDYYYLDVDNGLDIPRFKQSCAQTMERLPVLRSCFQTLCGKQWQIVLRQAPLPLRILDVYPHLDQSFTDLIEVDSQDIRVHCPPVAFVLLRHKVEGIRFVIRLSYPQYDGTSLPMIFKSISAAYNGESFSQPPSFSRYLSYSAFRRSNSIEYWKALLRGSSFAQLPLPPTRSPSIQGVRVETQVAVPHHVDDVTLATVFSSAWALLLWRITGSSDVVYGHLVAGRNSDLDGIEDIVESCVNIVPVRAILRPFHTLKQLLIAMQNQAVALGEADSLGFREIVDSCSNWPAGSMFHSVIQHQNIELHPEIRIGSSTSRVQIFDNQKSVFPYLSMISRQQGDRVAIKILANTNIMTRRTASTLLEGLCKITEKLTVCLDMPMDLYMESINFGESSQ